MLPEQPAVFDASILVAMFGSETAVIASVLQTFMAGTRESLTAITRAFADHDLAEVASLAHRITGASRMSGAHALGHTARSVEQAAKLGDAAAVERGLRAMDAQWRLLQDAIDNQ